MELPIHAFVGDRPVKAYPTEDGGMTVYALDWETGDFVRNLSYLERITLDQDPETEIVSRQEFDRRVEPLQRWLIDRQETVFDTLVLRREDGPVDAGSVAGWLDQATFVTSVTPGRWRMHANRLIAEEEVGTETDPHPLGVVIEVDDDRVALSNHSGSMMRAGEFVHWLTTGASWLASLDQGAFFPLDRFARLFGRPTDPDDLVLDVTFDPLETGTLTSWGSYGWQLFVHSTGHVRFELPDGRIFAEVCPSHLEAWNAAVPLVDEDDPEMVDDQPEESVCIEVDTFDENLWAMFDRTKPPPTMRAVAELAEPWLIALKEWDETKRIDGLTNVRSRPRPW